MKTMMYRRKWIFIVPLIVLAVVGFGFITMALWNALLPEIFNLPVINFWQAAGLLILARLFFGSGHSKWRRNSTHMNPEFRNKIKNMTPDEKKEFFRNMHYQRSNWHHECFDKKEQNLKEKSVE
jgi:hypothetical protein